MREIWKTVKENKITIPHHVSPMSLKSFALSANCTTDSVSVCLFPSALMLDCHNFCALGYACRLLPLAVHTRNHVMLCTTLVPARQK